MRDEEAQAIAARTDAATPGPWLQGRTDEMNDGVIFAADGEVVANTVTLPRDAEFICFAREDIPALLAEVEASREIVRAVAELPLDSCACLIDDPFATTHAPDCWIRKARALLGDAAGDGEETQP